MVHTYSTRGTKRYRYYVCYRAQQRGWKNCKTKSVAAPAIEGAVLEAIGRLGTDSELVTEVVRQAQTQAAQRREQHGKDVAVAEAALRHLNGAMTALAGNTVLSPTVRLDRLLELQREIQDAEHRLNQLAIEATELDADQVDEADARRMLEAFHPVWENLTTRERVRLIQMLVAKVGYDGQTGKVTVDFRSAGLKELCEGGGANEG
jgi:site-specific DNA recombinase